MNAHGFAATPRQPAEPWRLDALWHLLHHATRAAAARITHDGADFLDEVHDLMAGPAVDILDADPTLRGSLDDCGSYQDFEEQVFDALDAAVVAAERAAGGGIHPAAPDPEPRRLLHHVDLPGVVFTGLGPYYPPVEEPRWQALARQSVVIFNAVADAARIGAARRELHRRRAAELDFLPDPTPAAKAALTRRLHRLVAAEHGFEGGRIPAAPRVLVSGSQGTGKTKSALRAVAAIRERVAVRLTEPSLAKADEAAYDYAGEAGPDSLPVVVVRGRAASDPSRPGAQMCQRHEAADKVSRRGLSVLQAMCAGCPVARSGCGHLEQASRIAAMDGVGLFIGAGEGLFTHSPAPAADLLIGDERLDAGEVQTVPLAVLHPDVLPYRGGPELAEVMAAHRTIDATREALAQPHQLAALRAAGIGRAELRAVIRRLEPLAQPDPACLAGAADDAELIRRLDALPPIPAGQALTVLRAVLREIERPRPMLHGLVLRGDTLTVGRLRKPRGIAGAGVLLLDGTGDPEHNRAVFGPRLRHVECRVERDAHVTGTKGRGYSRQSLTGLDAFERPIPSHEASSGRLRGDVAAIATRQPGPCLIVAPLAVEQALTAEHLPPDAKLTHFGALRGKNDWEKCESAVVVGQNSLSVADVEDMARPYLADDPAPFVSADVPMPADWSVQGWPYRCTRMRRMRDGSVSPIEVAVHPDPRVQAVYEQVREAEVTQAVDRVRPVFDRRNLVLMNSLALDLTYDREMTHKELTAGGTRFEQAMAATGVVPLCAADLHRLHPTIWRSQAAAEHDLKRTGTSGAILQIGSYLGFGPPYRYRPKGRAGSPSRVLIDTKRHPDPRAALEAAVGPLALFQALGDMPALPPVAPVPEPLPEPVPTPDPVPPDPLDPPFWPPWPVADDESWVVTVPPPDWWPRLPARAWVPQ